MSPDELDSFVERVSPYMARFLAIYGRAASDIDIVKSERGAALRRRMEEVRLLRSLQHTDFVAHD